MAIRPSRSDVISPKLKQSELFSDFMNSFVKTPVGSQLAKINNEDSVNQSLRNLIKTNLGERLFQPDIGSDVNALLFENLDPTISAKLEFYIKNVIEKNEPRINLLQISVETFFSQQELSLYRITNENEIKVTIVYNLINNTKNTTLSMILKRVR